MSGNFEFVELSGKSTLQTFTKIVAAPTGFEDVVPYTVGVVDLEEGGRALAWFGDTVQEDEIEIGMEGSSWPSPVRFRYARIVPKTHRAGSTPHARRPPQNSGTGR
jgi:hypothetical protein